MRCAYDSSIGRLLPSTTAYLRPAGRFSLLGCPPFLCTVILICAGACNRPATVGPNAGLVDERARLASSRCEQETTLLVPSVSELDFATMPKGGRRGLTFRLHNAGTAAVEVTEIRTGCECFVITLQSNVIEPGQSVEATATFDFSDDPNFAGGLCPEARGLTSETGKLAFIVHASVRIR
jgi:hypothetical protein